MKAVKEFMVALKTGTDNKKIFSIACVLISLLLLFMPWSKDFSNAILDSFGWWETNRTSEEVNAVADSVKDGASPYELIEYSFCYADILSGNHEGGLAGLYRANTIREYRLCAVWIILTIVAHVIIVVLHFLNKRMRGFVCPVMIFMILGLFLYLQSRGSIDRLTVWGFVSLIVSIFSCILWALHIKKYTFKH